MSGPTQRKQIMSPFRVLVTHSDPLTQAGLSSALAASSDFEVATRASPDPAARIDVLVADYVSALGYLARQPSVGPLARVLIVTTTDRECDIRHALKCGARGYVLQGCSLEELATAVRDVSLGCVHLCPVVSQRLAESFFGNALTPREEEVLGYVVRGLCNKEIANRLELSVGTVKSHLRAVYAKLDVKSRTHAVAVAGKRGILQEERTPDVSAPVKRRQRPPSELAALAYQGE
jgi:DNA-binding NarL/FixJ family response regulator